MRVGDDFRGADKCEIQRIEKQYSVLARNFGMKIESLIETAIRQDGRLGKVWSKMGDEDSHWGIPSFFRLIELTLLLN